MAGLVALAREIADGVRGRFGVTLEPEPGVRGGCVVRLPVAWPMRPTATAPRALAGAACSPASPPSRSSLLPSS